MTRRRDILSVVQEGKRIRSTYFDVRILASPLGSSRVGVIVPKHQHTAVDRNRLKRRLRELVRVELLPALRARSAIDVVIRAEREAYRAGFDQLRKDVLVLLGRVCGPGSDPV